MEVEFWFEFGSNYSYMSSDLGELRLPAANILAEARSDPLKARLRQQTDEARARGIFGAPTLFVGSEMFWGNNRLDEALQLASGRT
jgi:2-hydroxychromene-2-carboxylate isomerase